MEDILAMVEGSSTCEITTFNQIDHNIFKEFLAKSTVWDFYEMSKEEYLNKDDIQLKVFNYKILQQNSKG